MLARSDDTRLGASTGESVWRDAICICITPYGGTDIRGRECQFQTLRAIYVFQAPYYLRSMTQQISHTVEPDIEFEPSEIID
jgi:hypothetical protein